MNNLNLKNNEIGIYVIMVVIILIICFLPSNNFITDITKNTGSLIIAFVCVCLFMLLDNRLAVLFLVLLVVSYYKNMKNNLAEKFEDGVENPIDLLQTELDTKKIEQTNAKDKMDTRLARVNELTALKDANDPTFDDADLVSAKSNYNYDKMGYDKVTEEVNILNTELLEAKLDFAQTDASTAKGQIDAAVKAKGEALRLKGEADLLASAAIGERDAAKEIAEADLLAKETEEKILELGVSNPGFAKIEQVKNQQLRDIKKKTNQASSDLESAIAYVNQEFNKNIKESQTLCDKIQDVNKAMGMVGGGVAEPFLQGRIPEVLRENFIKGGVPFNNQERARNFKDSDLVKNLNGLATQNDKSGYDITGCRMITSEDDSITKTYDTLNGPPLSSFDYDTLQKEFVGTPFYPLNN